MRPLRILKEILTYDETNTVFSIDQTNDPLQVDDEAHRKVGIAKFVSIFARDLSKTKQTFDGKPASNCLVLDGEVTETYSE